MLLHHCLLFTQALSFPAFPPEKLPNTKHARTPNNLAHNKLAFSLVGQKTGKIALSFVFASNAALGPWLTGTNVNWCVVRR